MPEEAIIEYETMLRDIGDTGSEHFRNWMGRMILYCEAQDARLE